MATFWEAREALLLANDLDLIEDEELLLLYDVNTSKNLDIRTGNTTNSILTVFPTTSAKANFAS